MLPGTIEAPSPHYSTYVIIHIDMSSSLDIHYVLYLSRVDTTYKEGFYQKSSEVDM